MSDAPPTPTDSLQARREAMALRTKRTSFASPVLSNANSASGQFQPPGPMSTQSLYVSGSFTTGSVSGSEVSPSLVATPPAPGTTPQFCQPSVGLAAFAPRPSGPTMINNGTHAPLGSPAFLPQGAPQPTLMRQQPPPALAAGVALSAPAFHVAAENSPEARIRHQLAAFGLDSPMLARPPSASSQQMTSNLRLNNQGNKESDENAVVHPDTRDVRAFIGHPPPRRGLVQCYIKRDGGSIRNFFAQKYLLFTQKDSQFLLAARKRTQKKTANYLVSIDQNDLERDSGCFYGKVRSNFKGTGFTFYDKGDRPGSGQELGLVRQELGAVLYETNIMGLKGPRKMRVVLPSVADDGTREIIRPMSEDEDGLIEMFQKNPQDKRFMVLVNKEPTWNEQLRAYQLNFHGRATQASVKNFQLVDITNPNRVLVQFGKMGEDTFSLDFQYPLTAFQAFAIAITSFDNKLACE